MSEHIREKAATAPLERSADEVYIDYGPELPERYGLRQARVMVQDPYTLFVYWELDTPADAWEVRAEVDGRILHRFQTVGSSGFLIVSPETDGMIFVCPVLRGTPGAAEAILTFSTPRATPHPLGQAVWAQAGDSLGRPGLLSQASARALVSTLEGLGKAPAALEIAPRAETTALGAVEVDEPLVVLGSSDLFPKSPR